jgi:hypothetical protein
MIAIDEDRSALRFRQAEFIKQLSRRRGTSDFEGGKAKAGKKRR